MADKPILKVSAKLDKDASKKQIQKNLDEISKSLKITIGVDKGNKNAVETVKKETKQINGELSKRKAMYRDMFDSIKAGESTTAEFAVKSFNSRQKIAKQEEALKLKLEKDIAKDLKLKESLITKFKKIENAAKLANEQVGKFGKKAHTQQMSELDKEFKKLSISSSMTSKKMKDVVVQAERVKNSMNQVSKSARVTGKNALHMGEMFKTAIRSFTVWISATSIFFGTIRAIKSGISTIVELDTAFLELRKVSELTTESFSDFTAQAQLVGQEVGRTTTEVTKATAAFARMGFAVSESLDLAEQALLLTNIGDGIDNVTQSTDVLIATLKGFGLEAESASHIVDALNEVSNNYAVNTDDLAEGIRRVSSVMSVTGDSMEETLGMLTAMIEIMQDAPKAATALRTLSLRIMGLDEDGKSLGETFKARLGDTFLNVAGVALTVDGRLKSMTQIVTELGEVWKTLSKEQQLFIAQEAAGKRQAQGFISLMDNYKTAINATETAINSQGSALQENEKFLDSISGKTALFNQALETLWTNTINSETIKSIVDFGTVLLGIVDTLGLLASAVLLVTVYLILFKKSLISTKAVGFIVFLQSLVSALIAGEIAAFSAAVGVGALKAVLLGLVIVIGAVVAGIVLFEKHQQKVNQEIKKSNEELKQYVSTLHEADELQQKMAERKAHEILAEEKKTIKELREEIEKYVAELENAILVEEIYTKQVQEGTSAQKNTQMLLSDATDTVIKYEEKVATLENRLENLIMANGILNGSIVGLNSAIQRGIDLQEYWTSRIEATEKATWKMTDALLFEREGLASIAKTVADVIASYDDMTEAEKAQAEIFIKSQIAMTEQLKDSTIDRIKLYDLEFQALNELVMMGGLALTDEQLMSWKNYEGAIRDSWKQVEDFRVNIKGLEKNLEDLTSTTDKTIDAFNREQQAIKDIADEIDILSSKISLAEGEDRIKLQNELIEKYKEQQEAVHAYAEELRALKEKGGLSKEDLAKVNDELANQGKEWWKIKVSINGVQQSMVDYYKSLEEKQKEAIENQKESIEELAKATVDGIEKSLKAQEKLEEIANQKLQDKIDNLEEEEKILERQGKLAEEKAKREEILLKISEKQLAIDKAKEQLGKIKSQRRVRMLNAEGTGFEFVADIKAIEAKNEEIAKLGEDLSGLGDDLNKHDLDEVKRLAELEVTIEKEKIKKEIDANKRAFKIIKDNAEAKIEEINEITKLGLEEQIEYWKTFAIEGMNNMDVFTTSIDSTIEALRTLQTMQNGVLIDPPKSPGENLSNADASPALKFNEGMSLAPSLSNQFNPSRILNKTGNTTTSGDSIIIKNIAMPPDINGKNFINELKMAIATNK